MRASRLFAVIASVAVTLSGCDGCGRRKSRAGAERVETVSAPAEVAPGRACSTATDCSDRDPCTTHECIDERCVASLAPRGTSCDNDTVCDGVATCDANGRCVAGAPPLVDDGNACTVDACDPKRGVLHEPMPIDDFDACTSDTCDPATGSIAHTSLVIDDQNDCTADSCDPRVGVKHEPRERQIHVPGELRARLARRVAQSGPRVRLSRSASVVLRAELRPIVSHVRCGVSERLRETQRNARRNVWHESVDHDLLREAGLTRPAGERGGVRGSGRGRARVRGGAWGRVRDEWGAGRGRVERCSRTAVRRIWTAMMGGSGEGARLGTFEFAGVLGWIKAGAARRRAVARGLASLDPACDSPAWTLGPRATRTGGSTCRSRSIRSFSISFVGSRPSSERCVDAVRRLPIRWNAL